MEVVLHPYSTSDAPRLFQAATESIGTVFPWLAWCHPGYALEEARAWAERQAAAFAEGSEYEFVIESAEGRFLGGCGLNQLDRVHRRANLGYWVRTSACGLGVATSATVQVAEWAFRNTDLVRLEVLVAVENTASLRVAEKAGAVREGVLRKRLLVHGRSHDAAVFSIVRP